MANVVEIISTSRLWFECYLKASNQTNKKKIIWMNKSRKWIKTLKRYSNSNINHEHQQQPQELKSIKCADWTTKNTRWIEWWEWLEQPSENVSSHKKYFYTGCWPRYWFVQFWFNRVGLKRIVDDLKVFSMTWWHDELFGVVSKHQKINIPKHPWLISRFPLGWIFGNFQLYYLCLI